jgi:hypothetical protein
LSLSYRVSLPHVLVGSRYKVKGVTEAKATTIAARMTRIYADFALPVVS